MLQVHEGALPCIACMCACFFPTSLLVYVLHMPCPCRVCVLNMILRCVRPVWCMVYAGDDVSAGGAEHELDKDHYEHLYMGDYAVSL